MVFWRRILIFADGFKNNLRPMKRTSISTCLLLLCLLTFAQSADYKDLYTRLDNAIAHQDQYIEKREQHLQTLKKLLQKSKNNELRYEYATQIAEEYHTYVNDSAITYMKTCLALALQSQRNDWQAASCIKLGHQFAISGYYVEAQRYFAQVPRISLTPLLLPEYYDGMAHLCGEIAFYSKDQDLREEYFAQQRHYRDSLYAILDKSSPIYYAKLQLKLNGENRAKEGLLTSDKWMNSLTFDDPDYSSMAFFRAETYRRMGNTHMQEYWLLLSSIKDFESATMNQASLWTLAALIHQKGNPSLAQHYMEASWKSISRFDTHMRGWLVTPVMQAINSNYNENINTARRHLTTSLIVISLLGLLLGAALVMVWKEKEKIATTKVKLNDMNVLFSQANSQLSEVNRQLEQTNRVKDEYIGEFLSACSGYIEKIETLKTKVNRKLKAGQYKELLAMTNSKNIKEEEYAELHRQFDKVFLNLFPHFVENLNELLEPKGRIDPNGKDKLSTPLRIFALIRLGVDDSASIARFLNYSPNSIYCYRARIKNHAIGNRNEFEKKVKGIG